MTTYEIIIYLKRKVDTDTKTQNNIEGENKNK